VFFKRVVGWIVYLVFTAAFFSLPILLQVKTEIGEKNGFENELMTYGTGRNLTTEVNLLVKSVYDTVSVDSTGIIVSVSGDTSRKMLYLYVGNEKQDAALIYGTGNIAFNRIYLQPGYNKLKLILTAASGETLAVKETRIFYRGVR
jgi:hypothetical protein